MPARSSAGTKNLYTGCTRISRSSNYRAADGTAKKVLHHQAAGALEVAPHRPAGARRVTRADARDDLAVLLRRPSLERPEIGAQRQDAVGLHETAADEFHEQVVPAGPGDGQVKVEIALERLAIARRIADE